MVLKLYSVSDGPPSLSCRQVLAALDIPFELVDVNFNNGEHMTEEYAKLNPQKEIPVLVDDGFCLSESVAIMQYLCDKYRPNSSLYTQDPRSRALINHRLLFNLTTYYASISAYTSNPNLSQVFGALGHRCLRPRGIQMPIKAFYFCQDPLAKRKYTAVMATTMAPIFFAYERTPGGLKRVHMALDVFETYLDRQGTSHAAADQLTIADFPLINTTMTLEAVNIDFSKYAKITKWYNDFKTNYPALWKISADGMKEIQYFEANPPDLSHLNHPIHPARKTKH